MGADVTWPPHILRYKNVCALLWCITYEQYDKAHLTHPPSIVMLVFCRPAPCMCSAIGHCFINRNSGIQGTSTIPCCQAGP